MRHCKGRERGVVERRLMEAWGGGMNQRRAHTCGQIAGGVILKYFAENMVWKHFQATLISMCVVNGWHW